jgi:integrase
MLDPYLSARTLDENMGDMSWSIHQKELKRGNKPATVNRYLALIRNLLRTSRDEWQWIDSFPMIRLLLCEVERDRWLTREEANRPISVSPPHLAALIRFALSTGCRASEITGLEWERMDPEKRTVWMNRTKYGTLRGVLLNADAVEVLEEVVANHPEFCFAFRGVPIRWDVTNTAWHPAIKNGWTYGCALSRFASHWGSWHRQARTSCDDLKDLGDWKSRQMWTGIRSSLPRTNGCIGADRAE